MSHRDFWRVALICGRSPRPIGTPGANKLTKLSPILVGRTQTDVNSTKRPDGTQ